MKKFTVIYDIKAHNKLFSEGRYVEAESPAEAKTIVKKQVKAETGRHTFDLVAKAYENGLTWEALYWETIINRTANLLKDTEKRYAEYKDDTWKEFLERDKERLAKNIEKALSANMAVTNYKNGRYCVRAH